MREQKVDRPPVPIADILITLGLLGVFAFVLWEGSGWVGRARLAPTVLAGMGLAFSLLKLVQIVVLEVRVRRGSTTARAALAHVVARPLDAPTDPTDLKPDVGDDEDDPSLEYIFATAGGRVWARNLLWVAGFFTGIWTVGLYLTIVPFILAYLLVEGRVSLRAAVLYAAVVWVVMYVGADQLLNISVPTGLW